jgi:hypothetical protein
MGCSLADQPARYSQDIRFQWSTHDCIDVCIDALNVVGQIDNIAICGFLLTRLIKARSN